MARDENQRPNDHNEDRLPEFTDTRGRAEGENDEFEDLDDEEMEEEDSTGA